MVFFLISCYIADWTILWILHNLGTKTFIQPVEKKEEQEYEEGDYLTTINDCEAELAAIIMQEEEDADPLGLLKEKHETEDYGD